MNKKLLIAKQIKRLFLLAKMILVVFPHAAEEKISDSVSLLFLWT